MKVKMKIQSIGCVALCAFALTGCVENQSTSGGSAAAVVRAPAGYSAAEQQLYALPVVPYYGALAVGRTIANKCPRYSFDKRRDLAINEDRNKIGRGSFAALGKRKAIITEIDAAQTRVFNAYGVNPETNNLCAVADAEKSKASAISALLVKQ